MAATLQEPGLKVLLLANLRSTFPMDSLDSFRKTALEQFEKTDFPTQKHEEWKYVNLKPVISGNFEKLNSPFSKEEFEQMPFSGMEGIHLVMIDGRYAGNFSGSDSGLTVLPITEGAKQFPGLFEKYFDQSRLQEDNVFLQMNTSFATEGVFICLAQNITIELPVFIHHIYKNPCLALVRNFIRLEENAELRLIDIVSGEAGISSFTNYTSEIFLGKNSQFSHYNLQTGNRNGHLIGMNYYHQQDSSVLNALTVTTQGALVRNNVQAILDGSHIESNLSGLYITNGDTLVDNHTLVDHRQPQSNSNELYKGLMDGNSTGVFNGKIFVRQDAQKTIAFQSNKNILLSPNASVNTKPQLEIFADDVKCSHGCTTGQLDEESMFYLRSRGIGEKEAKALLVKAYAFDVLSSVKDTALKSMLEHQIDEKLAE